MGSLRTDDGLQDREGGLMGLDTTALRGAGIDANGAPGGAVEARAKIFEMTQDAEEAVLRPQDPGAWSHGLRAALAARIAAQNGEPDLAARYAADASAHADLADPAKGAAGRDLAEVLSFMDRVACTTREVTAHDITGLQAAGVSDADIVRLAELNAFLAYQIRVMAGLRLMKDVYA